MSSNTETSKLLTPFELAELVGLSVDHLARLRIQGDGIPYIKLGKGRQGAVRYRMVDVIRYVEERLVTSTSAPLPGSINEIELV
jgi:hypothetical protein